MKTVERRVIVVRRSQAVSELARRKLNVIALDIGELKQELERGLVGE